MKTADGNTILEAGVRLALSGNIEMSEGGVLIVGDTQESLKLSDILLEQGYQVRAATSGARALDSVAARLPDLILLDIRMPGMDGFEVCRRVKLDTRARDVPIIFIGGQNDVADRVRGFELGGVDFIGKPYQREEVLVRVRTHLASRRVHEELELRVRERTAELEENLRQLRQTELAMNLAGIGIHQVDENTGRFLYVNDFFCQMHGYTREELLGMAVADISSAIPLRKNAAPFCQRGGDHLETVHRHKDGHAIPVEIMMHYQAASGGQPGHFICFISDISERKQAETALTEYSRQLEKLSRFALEAQETERRRLAIELHDELGQALTAVKINLQAHGRFTRQTPDEINTENVGIVENALQQVRRLALALRPSMLDDLGLGPALRWLAEQTEARADFVVTIRASDFESRLAPEIETACFRIAQEALTNIVRHAQARHVEIDLSLDTDTLQLSVQDDGCAFDQVVESRRALDGGSMGVLGMQERAMLIGGQLDIQSAPGQGTKVSLRCPLRRQGDVA